VQENYDDTAHRFLERIACKGRCKVASPGRMREKEFILKLLKMEEPCLRLASPNFGGIVTGWVAAAIFCGAKRIIGLADGAEAPSRPTALLIIHRARKGKKWAA